MTSMMWPKNSQVLEFMDNQTITSGPAGAEQLYYTDSDNDDYGADTRAVLAYLQVIADLSSGNVQLAVFGFWRLDGRIWKPFADAIIPYFTAASGDMVHNLQFDRYSGGAPAADAFERDGDFGPKVRYAIGIKKVAASNVVSATISAKLILRG